MHHRGQFSSSERAVRSQVAKLVHDRRLLCGTLVTMARTCGTPGCKCTRGQKHISLYLSIRLEGRRKMIYIPSAWEETIRSWVGAYRQADGLIQAISQSSLERFLAEKGRTGGPSGRSKR